jgi:predicted ATP-dependent Lon-type protease
VLVGNFDVGVEHRQRVAHLLGPLQPEMRDDTAVLDRIHFNLPVRVGRRCDRNPRAHEFSVQLRGFDSAKSGAKTGIASLIALISALLCKSICGSLVVVGEVAQMVGVNYLGGRGNCRQPC